MKGGTGGPQNTNLPQNTRSAQAVQLAREKMARRAEEEKKEDDMKKQLEESAAPTKSGAEVPDDQPPQPKQQNVDEGARSGLPGVTSQAPPSIPVGEVSGVKQLLPFPTDTVTREKVKEWVDNLPLEGEYDEMLSETFSSTDTVPPPAYSPSPQTQDRLKQVRVRVEKVKVPSEVQETPELDLSDDAASDESLSGLAPKLRDLMHGVEVAASSYFLNTSKSSSSRSLPPLS